MSSLLIVELVDLHTVVKELVSLEDSVIKDIDNALVEEWFQYMQNNYSNNTFISGLKEEVKDIYRSLSLDTKITVHERKINIGNIISKKDISEFSTLFEFSEEISFILGENRNDFSDKVESELGEISRNSEIIIKAASQYIAPLKELIRKSGIKKQIYIIPSGLKTNKQIVFECKMFGFFL